MQLSHATRTALLVLITTLSMAAVAGCGGTKAKPAAPVAFKVTSLDALKSYRFASDILVSSEALGAQAAQAIPQGGTYRIKASGTHVNPDRQQSTIDADLGFLKANIETISIGKEQWSREPQGQWQRGLAGAASLLATSDLSPQGLFSGAGGPTSEQMTQRLAPRPFTTEQQGGVTARHYVFDRKAFEEVFGTQSAVPEAAADVQTQADVWFAEVKGTMLRVLITGKNAQQKEVLHVDVQVSDIDAASNKIEPPI